MKTVEPAQPKQLDTTLKIVPFPHPQGCRSYLLADPQTRSALAIDVHLDSIDAIAQAVAEQNLKLDYVVDTHTHADHPSGSGALAARTGARRVAHPKAGHAGVDHAPADGEILAVGNHAVTVRYAPGHTPDHMVLITRQALFSGDTLLIGGVARTDFLGGDAGQLFDTLQRLLADLPGATVLYPGHDYQGRVQSTLAQERADNPWLAIKDRAEFVKALTANPPPRPANMDDLLRLNKNGVAILAQVAAAEAVESVKHGGAVSVIDVRTPMEIAAEHIKGSRFIPLHEIAAKADEIRATPAPRLLLCATGSRAAMAHERLAALGIGGLSVVEGGINAYRAAGGETVRGSGVLSLERQVRIAAGSLVLLGALLSFIFPWAIALSIFVGAGLVFAGITDWCGMGLLLAKMPWNQTNLPQEAQTVPGCSASACAAQAPPSGSSPRL